MRPKLVETVPHEILRLYEVARGCIVYGWFYYPLLALGMEQMSRVVEAAVRAKCIALGVGGQSYHKNLEALKKAGVIASNDASKWEAGKNIRNRASHPRRPIIEAPGAVFSTLEVFTERINQLYSGDK